MPDPGSLSRQFFKEKANIHTSYSIEFVEVFKIVKGSGSRKVLIKAAIVEIC